MSEQDRKPESSEHKKLGVEYFNKTWTLLDKTDRTESEKEMMIHLCHASMWHWMNAPECTTTNLSIGYWQLSRVYAVAGEPTNAFKYGNICLHISGDVSVAPFYKAYAHEAVARAAMLGGNKEHALLHLQQANELMPQIDEKEGTYLVKDLEQIINAVSNHV